jgi:hypothetical protein
MAFRENISLGKTKIREGHIKALHLGGDPENGTPGTLLTASAAELNMLAGLAPSGEAAGTGVAAATTFGGANKTVITLDELAVTITRKTEDSSGWGTAKLLDFPAGRILVLGVVADLVVDVSGSANVGDTGSGDLALGTVAANAVASLTSTLADLLPTTAITDPMVAGVGTAKGALAASAQFDGTTTAKDMHLNVMIDAGDVTTGNGESLVSGTVTVHWINLGDY